MEIERQTRRAKQVNLTPLIDVVFLLIVFFMLSTSFVVSESMELTIPSGGAQPVAQSDVLVLRVQEEGSVYIDGETHDINALDQQVRAALRADAQQKMLVLSGQGVSVQQLVSVLDVLYVNGAQNVQIDHAAYTDIGSDVKLRK